MSNKKYLDYDGLEYLAGKIQERLDTKQPTITGAATTMASDDLVADRAMVSNADGKAGVCETTSTELAYLSGVTSPVQNQLDEKQPQITTGTAVPTGGSDGDVYIQTGADSVLDLIGTLPIANGGTGATTAAAARENLDVSPKGTNTSNGAAEVLWSGAATTASFTVEHPTEYKFFLVQPGTSTGSYLTWIIVPYCSVANTTAFRGMGGFETESSGTEFYALRGSVSGTTVTIGEIIYRQSKAITTTVDLYVHRVVGIK